MDTTPSAQVRGGGVTVTRLYDVAYEIDLERVTQDVPAQPTRLQLARARPRSVAYAEPPVDLELGTTQVTLAGADVDLRVSARVYDFGAIRLAYAIAFDDGPWEAFLDRIDELETLTEMEEPWRADLHRVLELVRPALRKPIDSGIEIDHTFVTLRGLDPYRRSEELLREVDLVPALTGERDPLSRSARDELMNGALTYYEDDLVVIGPSRSLIVEPDGEPDVADVLGMAHAQLLELRYYDQLLARELIEMNDRIERTRRGVGALARRRYATLARSLYALHAEIIAVSERIDNALVVTEDVYLARVYEAALEQHRVPTWSAGVHRSLELVRDAYTALNDEATSARAEYLEIAIVILIAIDILLVIFFY